MRKKKSSKKIDGNFVWLMQKVNTSLSPADEKCGLVSNLEAFGSFYMEQLMCNILYRCTDAVIFFSNLIFSTLYCILVSILITLSFMGVHAFIASIYFTRMAR